MAGILYVCATPIGNMEDVTYRVVGILGEVSLVAAEDTRRTRKLLSHYGISVPLISYHDHNRQAAGQRILDQLQDGKDIALVSDAGMPGISDPGYELVSDSIANGVDIRVLPGANAALTALVSSGLNTDRFVFEGFLPRKGRERRQRLEKLQDESRTIILYESPHRVVGTLRDLSEYLGLERRCALCRELTKRFEETLRGNISLLIEKVESTGVKGECVIVLEGTHPVEEGADPVDRSHLSDDLMDLIVVYARELSARGVSHKDASKRLADTLNLPKRLVYNMLTDIQQEAKQIPEID